MNVSEAEAWANGNAAIRKAILEAEEVVSLDPTIQALLDRLPAPGTPWHDEERSAWLKALEAVFELVYPL